MKAKDNKLYQAAKQFARNLPNDTPESVIFGYAKLLLMNEMQIQTILSGECMDDLEAAHKWFDDNKLDLSLIKSGLLLLVRLIPEKESKKGIQSFQKYLEKDGKEQSSVEILNNAVKYAFIPFAEVFAAGREIKDIFIYQNDLKEKYPRENETEQSKPVKPQEDTEKNDTPKTDVKEEAALEETAVPEKPDEAGGPPKEEEPRSLSALSRKYRDLSVALLDVVKGQNTAVIKFVQGYNQGELLRKTDRKNQPRAYFFFFGPPGVGKTLLAQTAADALGLPCKKFNMSEYATPQSHEELLGIASFYNNSKEGSLTKFVRQNPECILIFDEIEKAHLNVIRQFLQILGSGELYNTYYENDISFKDATIIFTSNVGSELFEDRTVNLSALPDKVLIDAVLKDGSFPPEMCSRLASGNMIMFDHLSISNLAGMVRTSFDEVVAGMKEEYGVTVTYAQELPLLFLYNKGGEIDARMAVGQSGNFIKDEIYELMRQMENGKSQNSDMTSIKIDIDWKGIDPELKRLFKDPGKAEVLVFSDNQDIIASLDNKDYCVHKATTLETAGELIKNDLAAVYIDPFLGFGKDDESVLSISDYSTDGIRLFHKLAETGSDVPIYMMELDRNFSEVDRTTLIQEGASGTVNVDSKHPASFKRQFTQTMEELYMEKESQIFSQRGWIIDYNTKQELTRKKGEVNIRFYDLKKKMAVDVESRSAILSEAERPDVNFNDIIGANKAKEELAYFVNYLQNPKKFVMSGEKAPRGLLLYGPPGTGKTMLARAMAGECDVAFLQANAAEFMNKYFGESEANIRRLFAKARKYAPAIIFIDEIDAIAKQRTGSSSTAHTETMLNTLLTEMDGFNIGDISKPVFVLAATNFGASDENDGLPALDEAFYRRFDNHIYVGLPKEKERKEYIRKLLDKKKIDAVSDETVNNLADRTTGQSLAILQNVIELAIRNARKSDQMVSDDDLLNALEEYNHGEKKEHSKEYYREVAIHEVGHAYVSYMCGDKPTYITIEARGHFGGYMQHANHEDVPNYTREDLINRIRTSLAGRAAETVFFGKAKALNTGASSDLEHATECAWNTICRYGMEDDQLIVLNKSEVLASSLASEYVLRVNKMLKEEMKNTIAMIEEGRDKIQAIADVLVKENRLTGAQFAELMK